MDVGAILTVVFGFIVLGWIFQAMMPKTHKKIHEKLDEWNQDPEDKPKKESSIPPPGIRHQ